MDEDKFQKARMMRDKIAQYQTLLNEIESGKCTIHPCAVYKNALTKSVSNLMPAAIADVVHTIAIAELKKEFEKISKQYEEL